MSVQWACPLVALVAEPLCGWPSNGSKNRSTWSLPAWCHIKGYRKDNEIWNCSCREGIVLVGVNWYSVWLFLRRFEMRVLLSGVIYDAAHVGALVVANCLDVWFLFTLVRGESCFMVRWYCLWCIVRQHDSRYRVWKYDLLLLRKRDMNCCTRCYDFCCRSCCCAWHCNVCRCAWFVFCIAWSYACRPT